MKMLHLTLLISFAPMIFAAKVEKKNGHSNKDVRFWAHQLAEHAQFAQDMTDDENLKNEGKKLEQQFNELKMSGRPEEFVKLSDEIKKYQARVRKSLSKDGDKNKINLALLKHMDEETDYAKKKAQGVQLTKAQEAKFWGTEHQEEAETIAVLINHNDHVGGGEKPLVQQAQAIQKELKNKKADNVLKANQELNVLDKQIGQSPAKAKIPAKLAEHEKREREYAAKILERIEK